MGIRDLKNRLSEFLRRVSDGEQITVTHRGRPVALISPPTETREAQQLTGLVREGLARWGGGKPRGSARPAPIRGDPIARTVLEDRR